MSEDPEKSYVGSTIIPLLIRKGKLGCSKYPDQGQASSMIVIDQEMSLQSTKPRCLVFELYDEKTFIIYCKEGEPKPDNKIQYRAEEARDLSEVIDDRTAWRVLSKDERNRMHVKESKYVPV